MEKTGEEQTAVSLTESAHAHYKTGDFKTALGLYQQALDVASQNSQKVALHSNKAACYLKLKDVSKVVEECDAVLGMEPKQATILLLRAQSLEALRKIPAALADIQVLLELNPSHATYTALHARLVSKLDKSSSHESRQARSEAAKFGDVRTSPDEAPPQSSPSSSSADGGEAKTTLVSRQPNAAQTSSFVSKRGGAADKGKVGLGGESGGGGGGGRVVASAAGGIPDKENERGSAKPEASNRAEASSWEAIPKPKGHSLVDYRRWDSIGEDLSDEEEGEKSTQAHSVFRMKNLKILPVDKKKGEKVSSGS